MSSHTYQDVVAAMHAPSRLAPSRRLRPAGPRCRGGVSSVLRLAQPVAPTLAGWLGRAAELTLPARGADPAAQAEFASTIITRLLPSRELVARR